MTVEVDEIVCGGEKGDFLTFRYLSLSGDQFTIGRDLGSLWRERHDGALRQFDPLIVRAQREWMAVNWPQNFRRVEGVADALEIDMEDENLPLSLPYNIPEQLLPPRISSGCSCAYYPPSLVENGSGVLARNLDLPVGSLFDIIGLEGPPNTPPHVSQPYLIKTTHDNAPSTLMMCYFDLLGVCIDGINSEGLAIALLQDTETLAASELSQPQGAGAQEGLLPKMILESCSTVEDAKVVFLKTKRAFMEPTHYIVCDSSGAATIAEYSKFGSIHFTDIAEGPLCVTNHLLYDHKATESDGLAESRSRLENLRSSIAGKDSFDFDDIRNANESVHQTSPLDESPVRTIWTSLWDTTNLKLEIDFYLGENAEGGVRRSEKFHFAL